MAKADILSQRFRANKLVKTIAAAQHSQNSQPLCKIAAKKGMLKARMSNGSISEK
jgi:hypothetical protein